MILICEQMPQYALMPKSTHRKPTIIYEIEEANNRLFDIFRNHGLEDFPHEKRRQLAHFYRLLMTHQLSDNVTRLTKFRDIAIKHFIDSVYIAKFAQLTFPLLDMGTGPGFPGIPLKILYPEDKIILAEGVRRRVEFLKGVRDEMKLPQLDVIGRYVDPTFLYPVNGVITRAVEPISQSLKNVSQCLSLNGFMYLMKGPNVLAEIKEAQKEWGEYYQLEKNHTYTIPQTPHERSLVVFRKIKSVPLKDKI